MNLYIQEFPDEVQWKLREIAFRGRVTLRQLVIHILQEWVETDRDGGRPAEAGKKLAVGEKIKGQMERLGRKVEAAGDEVEF